MRAASQPASQQAANAGRPLRAFSNESNPDLELLREPKSERQLLLLHFVVANLHESEFVSQVSSSR